MKESYDSRRRFFFRHCLAEMVAFVEELMGRPQMLLSDLSDLSDEVIRSMAPVFNHGRYALMEGGRIMAKGARADAQAELTCQLDQRGEFVAQRFDGNHTVEEISRITGLRFGLTNDDAYREVKDLFLGLAARAICRPLHAHDRTGEDGTDETD